VALKRVLWSESIRARVESGGRQFLARASLRALSAGTASVFLDIATADRPDLIILSDGSLDVSPLEICRRIRSDERIRSIPILAMAPAGEAAESLKRAGCTRVLDPALEPQLLQETIAGMLGIRLRRYARYPLVLPVARGRIFHEFLGYSNALSEGGMGFDTISRIRAGEHLPLRIYRNTEERPITVTGRVAGVRPNIETGVGYAVGVEFLRLASSDRGRLVELFPGDPSLSWGSEDLPGSMPSDPPSSPPAH